MKPRSAQYREEIRIGAFLLYGRKNDIRSFLFARLELYGAWKANLGRRIISLGKMPINRAERHIELRVRSDDMIDVLPLLNARGNDAILLVKRRTVQRNAFACIVQERFVFSLCLRSDIEKAEEAAVSGTALGAGVADEGRLVEQGAEFVRLHERIAVLFAMLLHFVRYGGRIFLNEQGDRLEGQSLVEPVHDFLAVLCSKVLVLLVVVCLLHDDSLLCVERFLTLNSAINSSQSKSHQ